MKNKDKILINENNWHDYLMGTLKMDFDNIMVEITDEYDKEVVFKCEQYIGISYLGHWDESIIKDIYVRNAAELTEKSLCIVKKHYSKMIKGGGYRSIDNEWIEFVIEMLDDNCLSIICANVCIEEL